MKEWSEHTLKVNGVALHYYRYLKDDNDTKRPPVLLLHGFIESALCWTRLARALADDYDIYSYDTRGHGHSREPVPPDSFTLESLLGDTVSLIEHLALSEPPALIGHSMGAHIAALLGRVHPNLVKAIVLEDPPWSSFIAVPPSDESLRELQEVETRFSAIQQKSVSQIIAESQAAHPEWSDEEFRPWVNAQKQFNLDVFRNGALDTRGRWRAVVQDLQDLQDIEPPTLLLTGEHRLGSYITQDIIKKSLKTMREAYHRQFEGAGHYIRRDKFDEYVVEVKSFLKQHHRGELTGGIFFYFWRLFF